MNDQFQIYVLVDIVLQINFTSAKSSCNGNHVSWDWNIIISVVVAILFKAIVVMSNCWLNNFLLVIVTVQLAHKFEIYF